MNFDFAKLPAAERYALMTQSVIPRPIAWVLTQNDDADYNLAPFSYFAASSSEPPLLGFSVGQKPDGTIKDTLRNIRARNRFVIHIAADSQLNALNESSATRTYGDSEITAQKLPTVAFGGKKFPLPRLRDAPLAFACRSEYIVGLNLKATQHFIIGEVLQLYAADKVTTKDAKGRTVINPKKVAPLLRLGAGKYSTLNKIIRQKRPT